MIKKGIVSSTGSNSAVIIIPTENNRMTHAIYVPAYIPALSVGDMVAFVEFEDLSGVVLARLEG